MKAQIQTLVQQALARRVRKALVVTLVGMGLAATAGYSFSRYKFRGRDTAMIGLITTQMFPVTMLLLPLFIMLIKIKAYDNYMGLIIAYSATALPFTIWQMKGYYDTIPFSLEEVEPDGIDGDGILGSQQTRRPLAVERRRRPPAASPTRCSDSTRPTTARRASARKISRASSCFRFSVSDCLLACCARKLVPISS